MLDYEISPADAAALLKEKSARLVDVREPWELETARIEGCLSIPMNEIPARVTRELEPGERLLVLCHHGVRSMNVVAWLRRQGFAQAQSVSGGIEAWSLEVDHSLARY
jgi:rhodanese-related sulfurtransferase